MTEEMNQSKRDLQKNIRNRFASLGVQLGADGIVPKKTKPDFLIENVVTGDFEENQFGRFFFTETRYPMGTCYGNFPLTVTPMPEAILRTLNPCYETHRGEDFIFIDTETSGLSGGVGTWAFMIGVVRQVGDEFVAKQFFMRNPAEERAMLLGLEQFVADAKVIVSFNGKSFDVPMLRTRVQMQRMSSALFEMAHYDLLHYARRLWRFAIDDRRLGNLEVLKLGVHRTQQDVPGFIIPSLYRDYLKTGDARPLKSIFYHNLVDIVSLVTLTNVLNQAFDFEQEAEHQAEEWFGLAKHAEAVQMEAEAIKAYSRALAAGLPRELTVKAKHALAGIYKRQRGWQAAMDVWQPMAEAGDVEACVELAKAFEHRSKEFGKSTGTEQAVICEDVADKKQTLSHALRWTNLAIEHVAANSLQAHFWLDELNHRKNRISDKIQRLNTCNQKEDDE